MTEHYMLKVRVNGLSFPQSGPVNSEILPATREICEVICDPSLRTLRGTTIEMVVEEATPIDNETLQLKVSAKTGTPKEEVVSCLGRYRFGVTDTSMLSVQVIDTV